VRVGVLASTDALTPASRPAPHVAKHNNARHTTPSRLRPAPTRLEQTIEAEREQLLQARGVLTCLYEVLLHAEGDDAVSYAQAAHAVASLIDRTVERRCAIASR